VGFFDSEAEARAESLWGQGLFEDWTLAGTVPVETVPFGVEVRNTDSDPIRKVRVALAWDGATVPAGGPTPLGADDVASFEVRRIEGAVLEVWVSAAAPLRLRRLSLGDLERREDERDEADERDRRAPTLPTWAPWAAAGVGGLVLAILLARR
jgi:hypothetical protein